MIRINKIHFINYLIHKDVTFEFQNNFQEIVGPNEFGKSTLLGGIVDVFSFNPKNLLGKTTKGTDKSPVIEMNFQVDEDKYTIVVNSQEESITLRGNDGTYLTSVDSIRRFFENKDFFYFPYVVKKLLYLRERDLFIDADSSEFKKFTEDILNVDKINKLISIIEKIIGKRFQFKSGKFADLYNGYIKEYDYIATEISNIEQELTVYIERIDRFNQLDATLKNIKNEINSLSKKIEVIDIISESKRFDQLKENYVQLKENLDKLEKEQETLEIALKKIIADKNNLENKDNLLKELKIKLTEFDQAKLKHKSLNEALEKYNKEYISYLEKKDNLQRKIEQLQSYIKKLENNIDKQKKELDHVFLKEKEINLITTQIDSLNKTIEDANSLKSSLEKLENELSPYNKYNILSLKNLLNEWSAFESLKEKSIGVFEVIKGSIVANGKRLSSGEKIEFSGELILEDEKLLAKVYSHENLSKLENRLKPHITIFKTREFLEQIISKFEELARLKSDLQKIPLEKIILQRDKYSLRKRELEKKILKKDFLTETISKLEEDLTIQKKLFERLNNEFFKINKIVAELQGNIKSIEKDLKSIDLEKNKSHIQRLLELINMDLKLDDITITMIDELINNNLTMLSTVKKNYDELIAKRAKYDERKKHLSLEIRRIQKELEKSDIIYQKLDNLTIKEVREFEDKSFDDLDSLKIELKEKFHKVNEQYEALLKEYFELKGLIAKVPDKELIEEKRKKIVEIGYKIDNLEKIKNLLNDSNLALKALRENLEKTYLKNLQKKTSEIFSELTENKYRLSIYNSATLFKSGEEFARSWIVEDYHGRSFSFDELSDGTRSQLLLSIRLSLISSFLGNRRAFLLLDEPFAYFDENRKRLAKNVLNRLSELGWQIILVSARN